MTASHAVFIASQHYRGHHYGRNHPLGIPRVPLTLDLIRSYGELQPKEHLEARPATADELAWFHTPEYVQALQISQAQGKIDAAFRQRHNIGNFENPWFDGLFTIPSLAAGASIQAAEQVIAGRMAFNPAGGMHHAISDRARGFCYINDAVLGIHRLRQEGWRVLYFDMDAHQGDGVALALAQAEDVLTVSFHMDTAYAYPRKGGGIDDFGPNANEVNLPLPKKTNDSEYRRAFTTLWPRLLEAFSPHAVVLQAGTDILAEDPLGKMNISNGLFWEVVDDIRRTAPCHADGTPCLLVVGGGGYHPIVLARCWAGVWSRLTGRPLSDVIPAEGTRLLQQVAQDLDDMDQNDVMCRKLEDAPKDGPVRPEIEASIHQLLSTHPLFAKKSTISNRDL